MQKNKEVRNSLPGTSPKCIVLCFSLFFACIFSALACEKPFFEKTTESIELNSNGLPIVWQPVAEAHYYELRYSVKVPEGRTLLQRERKVEQAAYQLTAAELPSIERLQLLIEVTAQCNTARSAPAFTLLAIRRSTISCEFVKEIPAIKNGELHVPSVQEAQHYLVCIQHADKPSACRKINVGKDLAQQKSGKYSYYLLSLNALASYASYAEISEQLQKAS